MPYHIGDKGTHGCSGYPVVKDSDGEVMGCHKTEADAKRQLAALYVNEPEASKSADSGFVPPQEVRNNAKRGLELREKYGRGGTAVGVARARDLSNGKALSLDTLKRMNSYFARHEVDKKGKGWGVDSAGYIAWLLWGGDAGRAWAKRITSEQENKEKSMASNLTTTSYFSIEKADRNPDGTMTVYGKATDDSIDIDQQICDGDWLKRAMPAWFKSGGNIREQHSNIAAGVAKEYEAKADGHYIGVLVVDPVSVKKVDAGVLKGFSVGIKNPRVVRDAKAANGRIIDGQIVEVSLVDRPANPNCQLVLAKSVEGYRDLIRVEELIEKKEDEKDPSQVIKPRKGEPADKELYAEVIRAAKEKFDVYPSAYANAWVVREYKKRGGKYKAESKKKGLQSDNNLIKENPMGTETIAVPESILGDLFKFDKDEYERAREALANLISIEAQEMKEGHNEIRSISHLLEAVAHLHAWYEGEEEEGEVMEETEIEMAAKSKKEMMPKEGESLKEFKARCKEAGMPDDYADKCYDKYMSAHKEADADACPACGKMGCKCTAAMKEAAMKKKKEAEADLEEDDMKDDAAKSADIAKCLECGCTQPGTNHGMTTTNDFANVAKPSHVTTATMISAGQTAGVPFSATVTDSQALINAQLGNKSAEGEEVPAAEEEKTEEVSADENSAEKLEAIVEEVVDKATKALKSEIANLVSAKEAAEAQAMSLKTELATAKSLALGGGPKRTVNPVDVKATSDLLTKAAVYKAKAQATTDPVLAKGYKQLADEFFAKYDETLNKSN